MNILWGVVLSLIVAVPAFLIGRLIPVVGGPVFAILLGMLVALQSRPARFEPGLKFVSKKVLQAAIVLLGFAMNLGTVLKVGGESLAVMAFTLAAAFLCAWLLSRALGLGGRTPVLIGVGTAICGGSAIAAAAPAVGASDDEVAHSISTIFLFNVAAVFLFPPLGRALGMSDAGFGLWAGTAVNDTSSVVAAGLAFSDAALAQATIVKLTRTLLIVPVVVVLAWWFARKSAAAGGAGPKASLAKVFPWFVLGFLAAALVNSTGFLPGRASGFLADAGKFLIVLAMAAIGLNTNLKKLLANGWKPLVLGLACWIAVAATSLGVQAFSGRW